MLLKLYCFETKINDFFHKIVREICYSNAYRHNEAFKVHVYCNAEYFLKLVNSLVR